MSADGEEEHTEESSSPQNSSKWKKGAKMVLPHAGLYLFLFFYLLVGASIFYSLEFEADGKLQRAKIERIKDVYKEIAEKIRAMAPNDKAWQNGKDGLFKELSKLSSAHENRAFSIDSSYHSRDAFQPRWTKSGSLLYALSILTTTGYSYAVPITPLGQYTAIAYGLLGIPMMVLAAVDIGRFLSHIVLEAYSKYKSPSIWEKCSSTALLENSISFFQPIRKYTPTRTEDDLQGIRIEEQEEEEEKPPEEPSKRLPLSINASILLVFCMMGGLMYIAAGGKATFIEAFFVTFNLVANLTMSEMPNDLNHVLTLIYIFVFVTFGVAVLSMCAELAAFELKEIFLKIHYFGRKINFKRKQKKEQMEVEVKELLKIIEEIRRRYPEKEHITSYDILQFMHEAQQVPTLNERRDTIAFMPQTMEILRFADEQDMEERSASRLDEIPLMDGERRGLNIRMVDILQFSEGDDIERRVYQEMRKYTRQSIKTTLQVYKA